MKHSILIVCFSLLISASQAQDCKVLLKSINKTYTGDCKKGKAHGAGLAIGTDNYKGNFKKGYPDGQGVYTWSNGDVFEGMFKKGKKEGAGKMTYKTNSLKDSVVTGFWKKDKYVGLYEKPYKKIEVSQNVTSVRFTKTDDPNKKIRIYIREDNVLRRNPQMNIVVHHGLYEDIRTQNDFVEITNVTFPMKLRTTYGSHFFEIEIFESGSWDVRTIIENIKGLENKN